MDNDSNAARKSQQWAAKVLVVLTTLPFSASAFFKLTSNPVVMEGFARIGIPAEAVVPIGMVELLCLILYIIPRTTILGTLLLTGYLGGATLANMVGGTDCLHALAVGTIVWAGAWLRVPGFRRLVPFVRSPKPLEPAA